MARKRYVVVLHHGEWKVRLEGEHFGPYHTHRAATRAAIDAAHLEGQQNPDGTQVLVQGENNIFRTEWISGKDPYPPPG